MPVGVAVAEVRAVAVAATSSATEAREEVAAATCREATAAAGEAPVVSFHEFALGSRRVARAMGVPAAAVAEARAVTPAATEAMARPVAAAAATIAPEATAPTTAAAAAVRPAEAGDHRRSQSRDRSDLLFLDVSGRSLILPMTEINLSKPARPLRVLNRPQARILDRQSDPATQS